MASWRHAVILDVLRVDVNGDSGRSDCIHVPGVSVDGVGDASWFDRLASAALTAFSSRGEHPLYYLCHVLRRLDDMERATPYSIEAALRAAKEADGALRRVTEALRAQLCSYIVLLIGDVGMYHADGAPAAQLPTSYRNLISSPDAALAGHAAFLTILINEDGIRALFPVVLPQLLAAAAANDAVSSTFCPFFALLSEAVQRSAYAPPGANVDASASGDEGNAVSMYPGGQVGLSRDVMMDLNAASAGRAGSMLVPSVGSGNTCMKGVMAARPLLELLAVLVSVNRLVGVLIESAAWAPTPLPRMTGKQLQSDTFLGKVLSVTLHRSDLSYSGVDLVAAYRDLPSRGDGRVPSDDADGDAGFDATVEEGTGLSRLVPAALHADMCEHARARIQGQLTEVTSALRGVYNSYLIAVRSIVDLLARKGGKDALFTWYGALIDANADRSKMQYTHMRGWQALKHLSSTGFIMNALHALIPLVYPFADPSDVKSAKIDLRYLSACTSTGVKQTSNGRFTLGRDSSLAPFFDGASADASAGASWIDPRNLARQQAYMQRQTAIVREAHGGAAAVTASPGGPAVQAEPVAFTPIAEMYGLVFTLAHVGAIAAHERMSELGRQLARARAARVRCSQELRHHPRFTALNALEMGQLYAQWKLATFHADMLCEMLLMDEVYLADDALAASLFRLYRLHAVVMTRAACPPFDRHVTGVADAITGTSLTSTPTRSATAATDASLPALSLGAPAHSASPARVEATPTVLPLPVPSLPLPPPKPVLCGMPEHALSDISEFLTWMGRTPFAPRGFLYLQDKSALEDVFKCLVLFIASGVHVHNPYLRGNMVRAMQVFIPHASEPWRGNLISSATGGGVPTPALHRIVVESPIALSSVLPAVSEFHVDIEHSGSHTAFYDKFNYRVYTSDTMMYLWDSPGHRATLCAYATGAATAPKFLRFANAIINDLAYEMEEALKSIAAVRQLEIERDAGGWTGLSQADVADKELQLRRDEGTARGMLQYAVQQAALMSKLTQQITYVWLSAEKRAHVCAVLGFLLDQLAGEKRASLAVRNKAALGFNPLELLLSLVTIYNNLAAAGRHAGASEEELASAAAAAGDETDILATAVVADGRSFHIQNFERAAELLRKQSSIVATAEARRLPPLIDRLKRAMDVAKSTEDAFGDDIPEEVADPIQSTLMRDPVLLPTSKQVMDRAVIMHWLLDQEQDPFNRQRLTASMLQPLPELHSAIQAWMAAKRARDEPAAVAALARAAAAKAIAMEEDTDPPAVAAGAKPRSTASSVSAADDSMNASVDGDELREAVLMSMEQPSAVMAAAAGAAAPHAVRAAAADSASMDEDDDLRMAMQLSAMEPDAGHVASVPGSPTVMDEDEDPELAEALRLSML